jgi:CheY-like chemotaxis protein
MLLPSVQSGVKFEVDCRTTPETDWMLADSHRVQQVYTNVITNAIKYTKEGVIRLVFYWDKEGELPVAVFECQDTGPGIPKHQQEELFQRFVQRGGAPGTGLGLAIAKHLVDLANGEIRFVSDPTVRPGTVCRVQCPFQVCPAPRVLTPNASSLARQKVNGEEGPITEVIRVLIIDDVRMNRVMLAKRIQKFIAPNSIITEAKNGEEALAIISATAAADPFDVMIVDQFMEESGGVLLGTELISRMRSDGVSALIIGCSGNEIAEQFVSVGCQFVWGKPMPTNEKSIGQMRVCLTTFLSPGMSWTDMAAKCGAQAAGGKGVIEEQDSVPKVMDQPMATYHHSPPTTAQARTGRRLLGTTTPPPRTTHERGGG